MAYVRRRTTKAGSLSTTLVEAYRDEQGQPRQRLLTNLHGEPDVLRALAKAIYRLTNWENVFPKPFEGVDNENPKTWPAWKLAAAVKYFAKHDAELEALKREIEILSAHCTASDDEIQAAIEEHQRAVSNAATAALGSMMYVGKAEGDHKAVDARLRRLLR